MATIEPVEQQLGLPGLPRHAGPLDDPAAASVRLEPSGEPFAGGALVNLVDVLGGGAAGTYAASGSQWHPDATATGVTGPLAVVSAGPTADFPTALPTEGCGPLVGFPAGAIAVVDRGTCPFLLKTQNAEAAGAIGVIVVNNTAGNPTQMGGETHTVNIPSAMVSQADGTLIKANFPANATLRRHPDALNVARACHDTAVILGSAMRVRVRRRQRRELVDDRPCRGARLVRPAADRPDRPRRCLVVVLVQRLHLRDATSPRA